MNTQTSRQRTAGHDDDAALASDSHDHPETTFAKAAAALDAGDYQHGANLAYQAAVQSIRATAGRLGMRSDTREELKAVVYKLDGFDPEEAWQSYLADPTTTIDLPLYSSYFVLHGCRDVQGTRRNALGGASAGYGTVLAA